MCRLKLCTLQVNFNDNLQFGKFSPGACMQCLPTGHVSLASIGLVKVKKFEVIHTFKDQGQIKRSRKEAVEPDLRPHRLGQASTAKFSRRKNIKFTNSQSNRPERPRMFVGSVKWW